MDFEYTPAQEQFRSEVRAWLKSNLPEDLKVDDAMDERVAPNREVFEKRRAWQRKLAAAGWVGLSWPKQYGGRAAPLIEQIIFDEEYSRARAPVLPGYMGVGLCGPTMMHWGTESQKQKFLPRILSADYVWCQGYSEPGAGSDLAGLSTRAEDRGDYFIVNGQKIWTSGAHYADMMFLLARTDPTAPKHRGISYLLLDMHSPGVVVRPLVLMNGHAHFNEVFFENVQVPKENLVGPMNEGWKVAMTTLMFERAGGAGGGGHTSQVRRLAELAKVVRISGRVAWELEWVRQRLAQFMIECEAVHYTGMRGLTRRLKGQPPGPEGSILKLFSSELGVRIASFATEMLGEYALMNETTAEVPDAPRWFNRVLSSRQYTIAGGTSEIQHNIIGERVLGLPKG
ncbi:MAG: acyl-CoA dehydrogenase family protein [Candidatus Binatus sp.]|uniref:acyl-CoA dehydrogenase family protein n=1 Tax=Candidatus Binatus sp. TaxID=2811406 RepID=UPI0027161070|nr:acyl-CoA dehydrogenase family protein [Candidatus Binatus sp.]MDO8434267.1 acyl-CoA dehydrogenase family protein [Candidatus Binatus sp.]